MKRIKAEKIGKFLFIVISIGFIVIIYEFISPGLNNYYNELRCEKRGGEIIQNYCIIKTSDYNKECGDNEDCEGQCHIENSDRLMDKWIISFGNEVSKIDVIEFENKVNEKVFGYCSNVTYLSEDCLRTAPLFVEKGYIYKHKFAFKHKENWFAGWKCGYGPQ